MLEDGIVIKVNKNKAYVKINKAKACSHCKGGCIEQNGTMITEADNLVGAEVNDTVKLEVNSKIALMASLVTLGIPLLALITGTILTKVLAKNSGYHEHEQILSISVGMALFLIAFIPVKMYDRYLKKKGVCSITIVEIVMSKKITTYDNGGQH